MLSGAHSAWKIFHLHRGTVIPIHHINLANLMSTIHSETSGSCITKVKKMFLLATHPMNIFQTWNLLLCLSINIMCQWLLG